MKNNKARLILFFSVFAALLIAMLVFQLVNPPYPTPAAGYTSAKASLLLTDRSEYFETTEEEKNEIFGIMVEISMYDGAKELGYVASFSYFDVAGTYSYMRSDGKGLIAEKSEKLEGLIASALDYAKSSTAEGFKEADDTDYRVPYEKTVKVYVSTSAGVFFRAYAEDDPYIAPLVELHLSAIRALADLPEETTADSAVTE